MSEEAKKFYSLAGLMVRERGREIDVQIFNGHGWCASESEARGDFVEKMMAAYPEHGVRLVQCAEVHDVRRP
jgi:hypothetical protein